MRPRERRCIITFATTTDAMAMEDAGREQGLSGRLIPIPAQISAGCGLAWSGPGDGREALEQFLQKNKLAYVEVCELVI